MPSSNPLPPKENALFKRILKCYELKQYKNGLKFAKQILTNPKFSEHGETLAMKGLTLNCLGRKEEAYDLVRRGLRNDLQSHVCWHVFGLLQRSDKKYDEAIKCYRNALKHDKENIQILRDLSLLQIQMRDLEGYRDTRYQLLMLRPNQRASWIGYAMSYHLLGEFELAFEILEEFRKTQAQVKSSYDYEYSELLLYQNMVLAESGKTAAALTHLERNESDICDKLSILEKKGSLLMGLQRFKAAEDIYRTLLSRNPDCKEYYLKLEAALGLKTEPERLTFYKDILKTFGRALLPRRLPLNFATGAAFETLVDEYLRNALTKGVPPVFIDLRPLYAESEKARTIERLVLDYCEALNKNGTYDLTGESPPQPVSTVLWAYYFLAQHYDFMGDIDKALHYVNLALEHTPTLIELYTLKGKIYKHAGDMYEAYRCADEAQSLDQADRYLNSKCAKYMLRAGLVKEAEETCSKFTREGISAMENLNEMQCMWFQTECALAFKRVGKYGDALKKCHEVDRHFAEILEDQFDFHTYCLRKMTLRSYVDLLKVEDLLRAHPFYFKAAKCAIEVYIRLHDRPLPNPDAIFNVSTDGLDPAELKKLRNKQRKARKKAAQEEERAKIAQQVQSQSKTKGGAGAGSANGQDGDTETPSKDELNPEKMARIENPLEEALRFLTPLLLLVPDKLEIYVMAFEIHYRKGKPLLMLRSMKRLWQRDPNHPKFVSMVVRFAKFRKEHESEWPESVRKVIDDECTAIYGDKEPSKFLDEAMERHSNSVPHRHECARMMYFLDPSKQRDSLNLLLELEKVDKPTRQDCEAVLESLVDGDFGDLSEEEIVTYRTKCSTIFPYSRAFRPPEELVVCPPPPPTADGEQFMNNGVLSESEPSPDLIKTSGSGDDTGKKQLDGTKKLADSNHVEGREEAVVH